MPSYGEQLAQWQDSDLDLAASITAAQGVFTAMDQVLDHAFREQDPVPSSD